MGVLGGFIHKVGLVRLGGASLLEIDADVEYYQPSNTHSSNHPVSTGWFSAIYGRDNFNSTDSITGTRTTALVSGACKGAGCDNSYNTSAQLHYVYFRISGASNLAITIQPLTTGNNTDTDLDFPFDVDAQLNWYEWGTSGNLDFKFTCNIVWN